MTEELDGVQPNTDPPEGGEPVAPEPEGGGTEPTTDPTKGGTEPKTEPEGGKGTPPEKYELSLPEDSLLDSSVVDEISAYAKEKGLSNEDAQGLLDREIANVDKYVAEVEKEQAAWVDEVKNDPELGGDNFEKTAELATRVVDRFGDEKLKELLTDSRYGDHPTIVRFLSKIGASMTDDTFVMAKGQAGGSEKSPMEKLYGNSTG